MTASQSGNILATSCRATTAEHAVVRIVSTSTWDTISILSGHNLTVTRIQFSPDDQYILTCSRDRGWRIFTKTTDGGYEPLAGEEKAHSRMVLDACWLKGSEGFATAGRDKQVSSKLVKWLMDRLKSGYRPRLPRVIRVGFWDVRSNLMKVLVLLIVFLLGKAKSWWR
jgi:WD40 repeat protein